MNDTELRDAALAELHQTTRGLKGYVPTADSHWGKALALLAQIPVAAPPVSAPAPLLLGYRIGSTDWAKTTNPDAYGMTVVQAGTLAAARPTVPDGELYVYRDASMGAGGGFPYDSAYALYDTVGYPLTYWGGAVTLADVGLTSYQTAWANWAIATAVGADGIQIDDCMDAVVLLATLIRMPPKYPTAAAWNEAMASFVDNVSAHLHAAGLSVSPNLGHGWNSDKAWHIARGRAAGQVFYEHFMGWRNCTAAQVFKGADWTLHTNWYRAFVDAGVPVNTLIETADRAACLYSWATYMLWWDPRVGGHWGCWPQDGTDPLAAFTPPDLGLPLEVPHLDSDGGYRRSFERGMVAVEPVLGMASG